MAYRASTIVFLPEARLAEIDISRRVSTKMLGHHLLQLSDLLVQRGDDADLPDNNGRVGGLRGRGLPQAGWPQHRQQRIGLGLDVMPAGRPQRGHHLTAGQPSNPSRGRRSPQQDQGVGRR